MLEPGPSKDKPRFCRNAPVRFSVSAAALGCSTPRVVSAFAPQLRRYAEVIVRIGLNLQRGQRLIITDPFDLQGTDRAATPLVDAVGTAALEAGATGVDVIWGDSGRLRSAVAAWPDRAFERQLDEITARLAAAIANGDALLFLQSFDPGLTTGLPAKAVAALKARTSEAYARIAPDLLAGTSNWTAAPAPTPAWAEAVFRGPAPEAALAQLWTAVFAALRIGDSDPLAAWHRHLDALRTRRDDLNRRQLTAVRFSGPGTDLRLTLATGHVWCAASLRTPQGIEFTPNLPTEEVFTAPAPDSAEGTLCVARPINYGGTALTGIELEFHRGRVVAARARTGGDLLQRLLATDHGAARLGEVALVPERTALGRSGVCFFQPLLDENALDHVALGDAYAFTCRESGRPALNQSLIHLDLPIDAMVTLR